MSLVQGLLTIPTIQGSNHRENHARRVRNPFLQRAFRQRLRCHRRGPKAFLAPAHPREGDAPVELSTGVTELKITPQALGFSTSKPMSRRERRRLRRLAAK